MHKYDDESMVRRLDVHIRLTEEEHQLLKQYGIQIRAPNLTKAARKAMLFGIKMWSKCGQNVVTFEETNNESKERTKESKETKKELSLSHSHTREDFEILVSWLSDNEQWLGNLCRQNRLEIRGTAAETLQQQMQEFFDWLLYLGEDIQRKGRDDTRRHFATWLPKHLTPPTKPREQSYRRVPALSPEQIADQLQTKRRREEASDQLLAQYDELAQKAVSYKEFKTFNNQPTKT
jgi:hypothetical protein